MARPIYPHELTDPDFQWLLSTYRETHPFHVMIEQTCIPVAMIFCPEAASTVRSETINQTPETPMPARLDDGNDDIADEQDL